MNPSPQISVYQLLGLSIAISITLIPCFLCSSPHEPHYANCSHPFRCGNSSVLGDLRYPFWGINRGSYCGKPGFELKCVNNTPIITVSSHDLRVIGADPQKQTVRVMPPIFWNSLCPPEMFDNEFTNPSIMALNSPPFNLGNSIRFLTILYGCPLELGSQLSWSGQYSCSVNNTNVDVHFATHTVNPKLAMRCLRVVVLPLPQQTALALESSSINLTDALNQGFELGYFGVEKRECNNCVQSGGECGNNLTVDGFTCYCPDMPYPQECPYSKRGSNHKTPLIIGVSIGSAVALLALLGGCFVLARRRRSQQFMASQKARGIHPSSGTSSNGGAPLVAGLGSNGLTSYTNTPSTTLSQTTPSYSTSRSDVSRDKTGYFGVHVFDYTELEHATCNFHDSKELGEGGFGTVYYGVLPDGRQVAVKRLYENSFKRVEQFMNEIRILAELHHKNLVALYGCTSRRSRELLLVYEYVSNGTVADHIHGKLADSTFVPWLTRLNIAIETAEALAFLHRNVVIHRDVKTTNILLDNEFHVKVADFGLSRLFPIDMTHVSTAPQGTPGYVDPDYYQCYKLTEKSDVYSFGVVLIELISSKHAVDITRHRHHVNLANMALDWIQSQELHKLVDPRLGFDKDHSTQATVKMVGELGFRCLQQDRDMRPTMDEVLVSLRAVQLEGLKAQKQEVVDILVYGDDVGLLTSPTPLSPELPRSNDVV